MLAAETSFISEGWEDLFMVIPVLNFVLIIAMLVSLTIRMDKLNYRVQMFDSYVLEALSQVIIMLNKNAQHDSDVDSKLTEDAALIARELKHDREGVRDVAQDLADRTQRADNFDNALPGSAADAASKSE